MRSLVSIKQQSPRRPCDIHARGCTCLGDVPVWEVYLPGGVPAQEGVPAQGVYLWGLYLPRGVYSLLWTDTHV